MHVLLLTAHLPPDFTSGATLQVRRLADALTAGGHRVDIVSGAINAGLANGEVRSEISAAGTVHWIGTAERIEQDDDANWRNDDATALITGLLAEERPDVVHAHALQTLGVGGLAAAGVAGIPVVVTMHDFWWWCARLFLVDRGLQPCPLRTLDSGCACARDVDWRRQRAHELGRTLDRVDSILVPSRVMRDVVLLNGVAPERVDVEENHVPARQSEMSAPSSDGVVRFLYLGGDHPVKGRDVVLAAAESLVGRRGWTLRAYGLGPDRRRRWWGRRGRPKIERLPAFAARDAGAVYDWADVLIIPSIARESFSLVAREALDSGLAVITSDCLGPTEVVHHGVNGLVVPVGDAAALAEAMARLLDDPALHHRLRDGARGSRTVRRTTAEHAAALVRRYRALVARSSS